MADLLKFTRTTLTGGGATAVDGISATALVGNELCWANVSDVAYLYQMDVSSGAAADGVNIIIPVVGTVGNKRWILQPTRVATTTNTGIVELATNDEAIAGTSTTLAVTPANLAAKISSIPNILGVPGTLGYGVGLCPVVNLPEGMSEMVGTQVKGHDNYGNYQFTEGSVFCYIPWFGLRIGHASNPTYATYGVNSHDIKDIATYPWQRVAVGAITAANPAVVTTLGAHMRTAGDYIWLSNLRNDANWKEYSGKLYKVGTVVDSTHFNLQTDAGVNVDASGVAAAFSSATDQAEIIYTGAEADGYATMRGFIDGGILMPGVFRFKYRGSKVANGTGWTMGSVKNGLPLSSASTHNPFAGLTGGANYYYSAVDLAHRIDGVNGAVNADSIFFESSIFIKGILQAISIAHGQAATSTANCGWFLSGKNYPKGLNKNTAPVAGLISPADYDDAVLTYESDGYSNCGKTGSGVPFNKTTHNGQNCGIADVNGLVYEINIGMTCIAATSAIEAMTSANPCVITVTGHGKTSGDMAQIGTAITQAGWTALNSKVWPITVIDANTFSVAFDASALAAYDAGTDPGTITLGTFYVAKPSTRMADFTQDNSTATGHWGATGVAAMMERIVMPWGDGDTFAQRMGSGANQVLSSALSGTGWILAGAGYPKDANGTDASGTALFGQDYYYVYVRNELCLLVSGNWSNTSYAGVGFVLWSLYRDGSSGGVGASSACYPVILPR